MTMNRYPNYCLMKIVLVENAFSLKEEHELFRTSMNHFFLYDGIPDESKIRVGMAKIASNGSINMYKNDLL